MDFVASRKVVHRILVPSSLFSFFYYIVIPLESPSFLAARRQCADVSERALAASFLFSRSRLKCGKFYASVMCAIHSN